LTHVDYSPGEQPVNLVEVEETVSSPTRKPKRRWWIWLLLLLLIVFSAAGYYLWTNPVFGEKLPEFTGEMIQTFYAFTRGADCPFGHSCFPNAANPDQRA